jgi:hypothetical protein
LSLNILHHHLLRPEQIRASLGFVTNTPSPGQ